MAIQIQGNGGVVAEVDGTNWRTLKATIRPHDYDVYGFYRISTIIPLVVTQAANGTLFSFRWGDATRVCMVNHIRMQLLQTAAATATIMPSYQVFIARAFTVADSAGTALTPFVNTGKKRTSMGASLLSDLRKSAVAAGLTVGTRTLDAEPILEMPTNSTITTPNAIKYEVELDMSKPGQHPIVFASAEGFIIRGPTVVFGAAGTANLVVDVAWSEAASY